MAGIRAPPPMRPENVEAQLSWRVPRFNLTAISYPSGRIAGTMPTLILIKHARPDVMPAVPSRDWTLSDEGRDSCKALAARLAAKPPDLFVTSDEPKAIETGSIVAGILKKPV